MDIGLGSFAVIPVHANVAEGKVLPVERPMFIMNKTLKMFYNLEGDETKIPGKKMASFLYPGLAFWLGANLSNIANINSFTLQSAECGHRCDSPAPCSSLRGQPHLLSSPVLHLAAHSRRQRFPCPFLFAVSILEMWRKLEGRHCLAVLPESWVLMTFSF